MTASFRDLEEALGGLPWILREQVLGYARSIEAALPDIFLNAGRRFDQAIANHVVLLLGIRKLYGIVAGSYWTPQFCVTPRGGKCHEDYRRF